LDWKTLFSTFALVFLAELGDKTQLATMSFSAGTRSRWAVFAGASAALVLTSLLAVVVGAAADRWLPRVWVRTGAGALFVAAGLWMLAFRNVP